MSKKKKKENYFFGWWKYILILFLISQYIEIIVGVFLVKCIKVYWV